MPASRSSTSSAKCCPRFGGAAAADQVDLLAAGVEPRPVDPEVGTVVTPLQPQHVDVEAQGGVDVVDVDRDVMDPDRLHGSSLAPTTQGHNRRDRAP